MTLFDLHTHSDCSYDGREPIRRLVRGAQAAGLAGLAVTDHVDIGGYIEEENRTLISSRDMYDAARYEREFADAGASDVRLWRGVELGQPHHDPEEARKVLAAQDFDLVIASLHNLRGGDDFYFLKYRDTEQALGYLDVYLDELIEISALNLFDTLGHIGYPLRYMAGREGLSISLLPFRDKLAQVFKSLARNGKALEVNASGFRGKLREALTPLWCLRLFRDCGGEFVTVGSDAHREKEVGAFIPECYAMLLAAGFTRVTVFEKRAPALYNLT